MLTFLLVPFFLLLSISFRARSSSISSSFAALLPGGAGDEADGADPPCPAPSGHVLRSQAGGALSLGLLALPLPLLLAGPCALLAAGHH